jgi:hypothetical protein
MAQGLWGGVRGVCEEGIVDFVIASEAKQSSMHPLKRFWIASSLRSSQ